MTKKSTILQDIKQAVFSIDPDAEVFLFGSRARGDFNEESDWDVLVLVDKDELDWKHRTKIIDNVFEVELKTGQIITTIIKNKIFWGNLSLTPFYKEVTKHGVLL